MQDDDPLIWYTGPGRVEIALKEINKARKDSGLKPLVEKTRRCLRCDKEFKSTQDSIRICYNCKGLKEQVEDL